MGNDSGIRRKHKQRTVDHKKHTVFPGMRLTSEVEVLHGSIKPKNRTQFNIKEGSYKSIPKEHQELWDGYDKWTKQLSKNGSSAALAIRNTIEAEYELAYRRLVKAGAVMKLKGKYSKR